jgi:photoactive yellow protein
MVEVKADEGARIDSVERILSMTQEEVDELPYGFVVLDDEGAILLYNRYEARMSRLPSERVVGKNWFRDVAPCTRVEAFFGRFRRLIEDPSVTAERFAFRFHFLHGAQDVLVQMTRVPEVDRASGSALAGARVFMMVERRAAQDGGLKLPHALALDPDRGRAVGPIGPVFPMTAEVLTAVLSRVGADGARQLGRTLGASIAAAAALDATQTGVTDLASAPGQLAAGALDDAIARAGLGRLALDHSARAERGVIGCLVRPAIELPSRVLAALYEGLLEVAVGASLGEALVARCLDGRELVAVPWRFALAAAEGAGVLDPAPGERSADVARRLGLALDDE